MTDPKSLEELKEKLAAIEHDRWSDWHIHCVENWNPLSIDRWNRQAKTPYAKLSDSEKASDRREVDRYWPLILDALRLARLSGFKEGFEEGKAWQKNECPLCHRQFVDSNDVHVNCSDAFSERSWNEKAYKKT